MQKFEIPSIFSEIKNEDLLIKLIERHARPLPSFSEELIFIKRRLAFAGREWKFTSYQPHI
jgi:hypothetical protein